MRSEEMVGMAHLEGGAEEARGSDTLPAGKFWGGDEIPAGTFH